MAIPNRETHGLGPAEKELLAEFERVEGMTSLSAEGQVSAAIVAGQIVLAKHIDRLGRMFFGERWEVSSKE